MTLLNLLGLASFCFVAVFTAAAYRDDCQANGQSRRQAIIEAWANILIGFGVNYVINLLLLPLVGAELSAGSNFALGWIYTAVSMLRQYTIRRWFNARIHALAKKLAS